MSYDQLQTVSAKMTKLRTQFFNTDRYLELSDAFNGLYHKRLSELTANTSIEARGLVIVGQSGSGKTTALRRLFQTHPSASLLVDEQETGDIASLSIPSPATAKFVGISTLRALGYPLRRDRTSAVIWDLAQRQMQARKVLLLHFDEAQDFYSARPNEMTAVINTLKSIMQNRDWPVSIILSGMNQLLDLINLDPQLARRVTPIHFQPLSARTDLDLAFGALENYSQSAKLSLNDELKTQDFIRRLIHASANELGIMIELILGAIELALKYDDSDLSIKNIAKAFQKRSGVIDGLNPFLTENYHQIDARMILGHHMEGCKS